MFLLRSPLANRDRLISPAALSRALDDVELELLRPGSEWLLSEGAGIDVLLRHPAVQTYDARGEGWHVFHFDPTVTTLRHRALPRGEDLPAGRRRSKPLAAPGYTGRKRGDVQVCRGTLQHAGSGAWLQVMFGPGNGDSHAELDGALQVVHRTCQRLGHPQDRALVVMDGQFGGVFGVDPLSCPKCFTPMVVLAAPASSAGRHRPTRRPSRKSLSILDCRPRRHRSPRSDCRSMSTYHLTRR